MTFCELRKKDVVCVSDGRVIGRVCDLEFEPQSGRIAALIVPCGSCFGGILHPEKSQLVIHWAQIACIGDDVILVSSVHGG